MFSVISDRGDLSSARKTVTFQNGSHPPENMKLPAIETSSLRPASGVPTRASSAPVPVTGVTRPDSKPASGGTAPDSTVTESNRRIQSATYGTARQDPSLVLTFLKKNIYDDTGINVFK